MSSLLSRRFRIPLSLFATLILTQNLHSLEENFSDNNSFFQSRNFFRQSFGYEKSGGSLLENSEVGAANSRLRLGFIYENGNFQSECSGDMDFQITDKSTSASYKMTHSQEIRNRPMVLENSKSNGKFKTYNGVHRLNFAYRGENWHFSLGRQAISWGQGRLFNPLDLITPTGPFIIDFEDIPGADAINITNFYNRTDSIQFVYIPFREQNESGLQNLKTKNSNALFRWQASFDNTDVTLIGGRHFRSSILGGETVLTAWDASFRFAYMGRKENTESPIVSQFLLGTSYAFSNGEIRTSAELFWSDGTGNENLQTVFLQLYEGMVASKMAPPLPDDTSFFSTRNRTSMNVPLLIQFSIGSTVSDTSSADIIIILDPSSGGAMLAPQFSSNLSDESIWTIGFSYAVQTGKENIFSEAGNRITTFYRHHF